MTSLARSRSADQPSTLMTPTTAGRSNAVELSPSNGPNSAGTHDNGNNRYENQTPCSVHWHEIDTSSRFATKLCSLFTAQSKRHKTGVGELIAHILLG